MSKRAPAPHRVMTMWGRIVHAGLINCSGDYQPLCGRSGGYVPVSKSDAVSCKRCLKASQEATNEHR